MYQYWIIISATLPQAILKNTPFSVQVNNFKQFHGNVLAHIVLEAAKHRELWKRFAAQSYAASIIQFGLLSGK